MWCQKWSTDLSWRTIALVCCFDETLILINYVLAVGNITALIFVGAYFQLKDLPESLANLVQMKVLDINNNEFAHVPACVQRLTGLVHFNMHEVSSAGGAQRFGVLVESKSEPSAGALM